MSLALTPPVGSLADRWNTLADALLDRAKTHAEVVAYADAEGSIAYGLLATRASAIAEALAERGVTSGDRVALGLQAGTRFAEVFWALQLLGAIPCAFSPVSSGGTLSERAAVAQPKLVLDDEAAAALPRTPAVATVASAGNDADAIAYIQPTSGTSGAPRAAQLTHRNALAFLRASWDTGHVSADDVLVAWVPPWHDLGLLRFLIGCVYYAVPCHIITPAISTIPEWLRTIARVRGTVSGAPDFAFRLATRMLGGNEVDLGSLRYITNGGEPPRMSTIEAFEAHFDAPGVVLPGYGLAEATLGVNGNVSCGWPLPGFEVRTGNSADAPEEILVRGDAVFAGYLDAKDDSAARLQGGWLHTGDTGYCDESGRLYVLGRRAGMIKRAGAIVAPRQLEEAAQEVPGVKVAAAVSVATGASREAVTLVAEATATEDIVSAVTRRITERAGFAPDRVLIVPPRTIPRTDNGKIRHGHLRTLLESSEGQLR